MNGGLCNALVTAANTGSSSDVPSPSCLASLASASSAPAAGARRDRVLFQRERPVLGRRAARRRGAAPRGRATPGSAPCTKCVLTVLSASCVGSVAEQGFEHAAHPRGSAHVVHAHDPAPVEHAVRDRGERLGRAGRRSAGRGAHRRTACSTPRAAAGSRARRAPRSRAGAPRSAPATCRGRGRRRARSARRASPTASARRGAFEEERGDVGDEVVVARFGVGTRGCSRMCVATTVASCFGGDPQVVGIAEAGDVVADDRAGGARGVEHRRPPGVDRDRHVETGARAPRSRARPDRAPRPRRPPGRDRPSRRRRRAGRRRRATSSSARARKASNAHVAPRS